MPNVIDSFSGKYRFLSNFAPSKIKFEGLTYPTVENAYQAAKTSDKELRKGFVTITPGDAKRNGRKLKLRFGWEEVKVDIMRELVWRKFSRNEDLKKQLLDTGDVELIEGNTWGDKFWGVCDGEGENQLGRILMDVRSEL